MYFLSLFTRLPCSQSLSAKVTATYLWWPSHKWTQEYYTYTRMYKWEHTHTHAHTHTHTHTRAHTYTHTQQAHHIQTLNTTHTCKHESTQTHPFFSPHSTQNTQEILRLKCESSLLVLCCFFAGCILQQLRVTLVCRQLHVAHHWASDEAGLHWQLKALQYKSGFYLKKQMISCRTVSVLTSLFSNP